MPALRVNSYTSAYRKFATPLRIFREGIIILLMGISARLADLAEITERCGALAQNVRGDAIARELKNDGSIVTAADRATETLYREELTKLVPNSTVWGEEFGYEPEGSEGLWVVDPVDGTSNFSFGGLLWGVSAALIKGEDILLAAVYLPDLKEMYVAEKGGGAYRNGAALAPIPPGPVSAHELVSYSDALLRKFPNASLPGKMRLSGAFVVDGAFVACQRLRGMIGYRERLYDLGACMLFNQELGADIRYANGDSIVLEEMKEPTHYTRPWLMFPKDSGFYLES